MRLAAALLIGLVIAHPARAADPNGIVGTWWTQDKDGVVKITTCPDGLCGSVVGITTFRPDGSAPLNLHARSRCHLRIISDGTVDGDGVWNSHITNPDDDKVYTINLRLDERGRLRMRGYIGLPLFGQTVYWTRFGGHLTDDCHIAN